ncbi:S1C family serine protease [Methanocella arvoryzae]|uniref:Trypsin-like protease n=1 Tax=Methanocella arvoryzae (strain DSM 22066 / NBRC 105507 / MRE50) TaxID=351160 RepID=Q0W452_METAR|nr:trypsin-like peptidase domain-containing protein [Methanocella arvoryzae]CAJ36841.1 putative trypsin-like protease [Methanocella arvoryzae MRE50]
MQIIEKSSPCVVNINTVMLMQDAYMNVTPQQGMGSGIVIDPKGYILTNNHIVENTHSMVVSTFDGTRFEGKLVGTDPMSDVAVVKVDPGKKKLKAAKLGDSDKIRVGQISIAIGNPFGFMLRGPTVTVGVISALNRTIQADRGVFENLIQTDAHINPGNSGGPLFNKAGEVIGMNSANIPFAQGIGFSIPINTAMHIARELIEHGKVVRPWLGILGLGITKELADYYNLSASEGILVTRAFANSPAGQQRITANDIILSVDGQKVTDMSQLASYVRKKKIGDVITLIIRRGNLEGPVSVRLAETPTM